MPIGHTGWCVWKPKKRLAFLDGLGGALISASAAGNADVGVDLVLAVTLGDSLNGALISAGAASDTCIGDNVSHDFSSQLSMLFNYD